MTFLSVIGFLNPVAYALGGAAQIQQVSTSSSLATILLSGSPPTLGSPNAPVAIVEFGDFQCPTCGGWYQNQEATVIQNLVNPGKARLIWRDFPFYGPDSVTASEAAYAAGDQGKFWQFHDLLYQNQQTPNNGWASRQNMDKFAQQLGLNIAQFDQDLDTGKFASTVNSNHQLGVQAGVTGTPTFFLVGPNSNIVTISGGQPEPVFEQAVTQLTSSPTPEYSVLAIIPGVALFFTLACIATRRKMKR